MAYLLLIIGFLVLMKSADFFVDGSSKLAKYFKIPPIIIGLTIVAFGTSSPEAAVSISASITGNEGLSVGNVIGSNLINISFIIALTAIIFPLKVEKKTIVKEIPLALLGSVVLLILISDTFLQNEANNVLSRGDGLVLIMLFLVFLYYIIEVALSKNKHLPNNMKAEERPDTLLKSSMLTLLGLIGIVFGGWLVVEQGQRIAISLGMSETLVGLTIVAIGTSLPELVTSIVAALKKESEIALGNIIGSNIFNIMFVLGISSTIHPLLIQQSIHIDMILMIVLTFVLLIFATTHKRTINRYEGIALLMIYFSYLTFIIIRN